MEKIGPLINRFISDNLSKLMLDWENERKSIAIWHSGPVDNMMLESINNIIQSLKSPTSEKDQNKIDNVEKIDLVVNSGGGLIEPAYQAIRLLDRAFPDKELNFVVPRMAKSAATLMACGCDKIILSQIGELGPLDVQIRRKSGAPISGITINRLIEEELKGKQTNENMKEWIYRTLKPEEVLELKRFNEVAVEYLRELLPKRMFKSREISKPKMDEIINKLCQEFPNHGFVIDYDTAKNKLNFNVEYASNKEEIILQNVRELWGYIERLNRLMNLNSENQTLKRLLRDSLDSDFNA